MIYLLNLKSTFFDLNWEWFKFELAESPTTAALMGVVLDEGSSDSKLSLEDFIISPGRER